jgi:hypothetical protein
MKTGDILELDKACQTLKLNCFLHCLSEDVSGLARLQGALLFYLFQQYGFGRLEILTSHIGKECATKGSVKVLNPGTPCTANRKAQIKLNNACHLPCASETIFNPTLKATRKYISFSTLFN